MKILSSLFVVGLLLSGCSEREAPASVSKGTASVASSIEHETGRNKYLAFVHAMSVETDQDGVKALFDKIIDNCTNDKVFECTLLESKLTSGHYPTGNIKIRAKREGIKNLVSVVSSGGKILEKTTNVEDLARPIVESNKRIDMLQQYQKRLLELEHRPNNDVDSLIKLSKELASTQSELEQASGENARLLARVNMDILQISIRTDANHSFWPQITESASAFTGNLSSGISSTITGLAYILPWLFVVCIFGFIGRKVWRKRKSP
ncbi:DUF4349 domain-containing protein [Undibacterium sp. MH2W]|uniref:DUF4349 domain-containing protein n=1 Tax=Undibacterium sp. MH2W TaxID=3413044 RepID=UPI003BF08FCA